ncbi:MAG: hypothetical protein GY832_16845 [Chloroflexi bacterium]|nr:hypothetical protein [Chloroflexota bacterium]
MAVTERTKRIFISDIHMGDEESVSSFESNGLYPYCWFYGDRPQMLADFLRLQIEDPQVKDVVILGDLFDEWVYPAQLDPVPPLPDDQFHRIAQATQNVPVIESLKEVATSDVNLVYVPGNHDMLLTEEILTDILSPHPIDYRGTAAGKGAFIEDGIAAEHGSWYCLFNAPDSYSHPGHVLPLGFFISRAVTEKVAKTGSSPNYLEALAEFILKFHGAADFAQVVYKAVTEAAGMSKTSQIKMGGADGYPETIQIKQIENWFDNLYEEWEANMSNNVSKEEALINDCGILYTAATTQYFEKKGVPEIVLFGHTHMYTIHGLSLNIKEELSLSERTRAEIPCQYIYANTGTWTNAKKRCTFVETQLDANTKIHYVRVKEFTEDGAIVTLGERHKKLGSGCSPLRSIQTALTG